MKVSFVLQRADITVLRHALNNQDTRSAFWFVRVILPALLGTFSVMNLVLAVTAHVPSCFAVGLFWGVLALGPVISGQLVWLRTLRDRNFDLQTEVELQVHGVYVRDGTGESLAPWGTVLSIRSSPRHILLLSTHQKGIVIPKRVFSSRTDEEEFLRSAEKQWQNSRAITPLTPATDVPPLSLPY